MKKIFLSYVLSQSTPGYGGSEGLITEKTKSIACGDSCNQIKFTMSNHLGTHIDFPNHFDAQGKCGDSYGADFWFFKNVGFVHYSAHNSEMLDLEKIIQGLSDNIEALIIKTDFCNKRDHKDYWEQNPGVIASSAEYLRRHFKKIRLIGFDFISLSSYQNRPEGRIAHKAFLQNANPILIVEDMDLRNLTVAPQSMIILPLRGENFDGAPVTVVAEVNE